MKKAWQKREKIKLSAKSVVEVGWFFIEIEESWGKVGCFLEFLAIFEKGVSRFWFGGLAVRNLHKPFWNRRLTRIYADLYPTVMVGYDWPQEKFEILSFE